MESEQVVFMVPKAVNARLQKLAKKLGVSKSWVARRAVLAGLERGEDLVNVRDAARSWRPGK